MSDERHGVDTLRAAIEDVASGLPTPRVPPEISPDAAAPRPLPPPPRRWVPTAALAAVALLALAFAAYLATVRLPRLEGELARLRAGTERAIEPVDLSIVSLPRAPADVRSGAGGEAATVEIEPGSPSVLLVELDPRWLEPVAEAYVFELRGADGGTAGRWSLTADEAARHLRANEGVPLLLRTAAGPFTLHLTRRLDGRDHELSSLRLEVVARRDGSSP